MFTTLLIARLNEGCYYMGTQLQMIAVSICSAHIPAFLSSAVITQSSGAVDILTNRYFCHFQFHY